MIKNLDGKRVGHKNYPSVKGTVLSTGVIDYHVKLDENVTSPYTFTKGDDMYIMEDNIVELTEDLQVGDTVEPLESTIGVYSKTKKGRMIEGKVLAVYGSGSSIKVEITKHVSPGVIGSQFDVQARHFAKVTAGFSVGDVITGTPESDKRYGFTNSSMTEAKVIEIKDHDYIKIEILKHNSGCFIGNIVHVDPSYFTLVRKARKFEIGDIVTGNEESDTTYMVTDSDMSAEVVELLPAGEIKIKVISHEYFKTSIGKTYEVDEKHFEHLPKTVAVAEDVMEFAPETSTEDSTKTEPKFKVGDIITGTPEASARYGITTENMTKGLVVKVEDESYITVKIMEHTSNKGEIGATYTVKAERFVLVEEEPEEVKEEEVKELANGKVEIELADGTELEFEKYTDFLDFMERQGAFK